MVVVWKEWEPAERDDAEVCRGNFLHPRLKKEGEKVEEKNGKKGKSRLHGEEAADSKCLVRFLKSNRHVERNCANLSSRFLSFLKRPVRDASTLRNETKLRQIRRCSFTPFSSSIRFNSHSGFLNRHIQREQPNSSIQYGWHELNADASRWRVLLTARASSQAAITSDVV